METTTIFEGQVGRTGNFIMRHASRGAGILIVSILAAVSIFLLIEAWPAISDPSLRFRTVGSATEVSIWRLAAPQIFGTVLGAVLAMLMAVPLAIGIALFISHYAPRHLRKVLGYIVDTLAAIPSVVYGLWGGLWLVPYLTPIWEWIHTYFGWFPLFASGEDGISVTGRTMASASVILAVMILPIITAISRDVFMQTPRLSQEAALALGATRWEMIKMTVLPFGRSGVISASMLGLGRALGETMAVVMVLSVGSSFSWHIFEAGRHSTIAANIALQFPESTGVGLSALIATGLILFIITMIVNMIARLIITKARRHSE